MNDITKGRSRFVELARELGPVFGERAASHDREGTFAADDYADLERHKVFSAGVPLEFGGGGASHAELCAMLRELGRHSGSTALALSMHTHLVATQAYRHRHGQPAEAILRRIVDGELVLVSSGAGDWVDSVGKAERVEGGFRVNAVKRFASGSPAGDILMTSAPLDDLAEGPQVIHFGVSMRAAGVSVKDDWDTLGMRATGSHSVELVDVFVPAETVSLQRPRGVWHPFWSVVITVAAPIYTAPYLGIAERAAEIAREHARAGGVRRSDLREVGELENRLATAQMAFREMVELTNDYAFAPEAGRASQMLVRKTIATNAMRATVSKAVDLVGGRSLFKREPLERLVRDVEASRFHPLPEAQQLVFTGRVVSGLPPVEAPARAE